MLRAWQGCCECGIVGRVRNATSHVAVHPRGIDATEPRYTHDPSLLNIITFKLYYSQSKITRR